MTRKTHEIAKAYEENDRSIRPVLDALKSAGPGDVFAGMTVEEITETLNEGVAAAIGADLTGDVPATPDSPEPRQPAGYSRMTNAAWRIMEEQRMDALEAARECDAQIKVLEQKRDDALRAADMCVAGQRAGEVR